ncbi:MAG: YbhB/YbcL family Raf kinase inhibitor-like protein [Candidatus Vogelbacteria bacterium CG10_big_fil_rev_8_21_14_0_10_45_14]|uniref:YbhB/YbcL family Raf kinase inhibitor-like protein n=1 Tax=Candidatus Vogelbacteria bacterium CG10_big_fil_rev_8_21_14_0_10_45_14 TaxID=1975042 RepID=A0A2H0RJ43_9BACT|nr:MAG: YbhB/YbcL family Raf kinase inhibitor-like protein [Candidatus Vogelbacteria bacterium CG10_big_fil_rev_8_21_14_0_10_45_14]
MPSQYTCDGENISPPLEISGAPEETESFALIVDDPDAPGGVWDHWLAWNIPEDTAVIEEGVAPPGKAGTNSFGKTSYGGPCPPSGTHRYFFKLYALDSKLDIHSESPKNVLEGAMKGHILEQAKLVGLYRRSN